MPKIFKLDVDDDGDLIVKEERTYYLGDFVDSEAIKPLIKRLNELADENERLKGD